MTLLKEKSILLTFDVEDWFQVENFKENIPFASWPARELRVEKNTIELLNLLDDAPTQVQATFFILGWIAQHCPDLVREIHRRGHEVASHGFDHHLCYNQSSDELRTDLTRSKDLLENITGDKVLGYRAPSFSISDEALDVVREVGFRYDSSYNSFQSHGRYGTINLPTNKMKHPAVHVLSPSFYEIPVSNLMIGSRILPWGGGGYFRLLPSIIFRAGVKEILNQTGCYTFYMHPWEIDPEQPRVKKASFIFRFRHYVNLGRAKSKLKKLITLNSWHNFLSCKEYLNQLS